MGRDIAHYLDVRSCDCCYRKTLELEQSSCVTSHIDINDYPYLTYQCLVDEFYCEQCLNELGFCPDCDEKTSKKNQNELYKIVNR
jgi:hypothetical protein